MSIVWVLALLAADRVEVIQGVSGSRSDQVEVQTGGLVLREGSAGAAFGTVRLGKGKRHLSYFVIVKHNLGKAGDSDFSEEASVQEGDGKSKQTVTVDGRTLEVAYQVHVEAGKAAKQTLTINRKAAEVGKGRVFLVDLTASPPRWEQRKLDLKEEVSDATSKKSAHELVKKVLARLVKQDRKVKEFVDSAGR
jgi:hypothetical protein